MSTFVGYARVSTPDQQLTLQEDALTKAGCTRIFYDKASGAKTERLGLNEAFDYLRPGDTLVVWKLDRLGRSLKDLIEKIHYLHNKGIGFKSLQEHIDTTTSGGKLVFHIFSALAEFERDIIRDRTRAGLMSARARGRMGGRPQCLNKKQLVLLKKLYADKNTSINDICKTFRISRPTLYRSLKRHQAENHEE